MTCTCTPAQYSQCHKRCERVAIDADYSGAEHIEEIESDFKYPTYEQAGGDKKWDEMSELEQANYNHCKTLNALAVCMNTVKRRRADIERLTLQLNLAEGRNRDHIEEIKELRDALVQLLDTENFAAWRNKYKTLIKKLYP